ncbi:hypothetical protein THUN1379_09820 [Paludibacterium sp. THUN1379]|uniref:hypothetical protein n=1 Tax=Paludibacterium sp. THUN1379 TaxID=3112107 RepID=UPI00308B77A4|nr:hypothetical protein THUN1379_09820 [Paludibacterium sp. THUN1379]
MRTHSNSRLHRSGLGLLIGLCLPALAQASFSLIFTGGPRLSCDPAPSYVAGSHCFSQAEQNKLFARQITALRNARPDLNLKGMWINGNLTASGSQQQWEWLQNFWLKDHAPDSAFPHWFGLGENEMRLPAAKAVMQTQISQTGGQQAPAGQVFSFDFAGRHFVQLQSFKSIGGVDQRRNIDWLREDRLRAVNSDKPIVALLDDSTLTHSIRPALTAVGSVWGRLTRATIFTTLPTNVLARERAPGEGRSWGFMPPKWQIGAIEQGTALLVTFHDNKNSMRVMTLRTQEGKALPILTDLGEFWLYGVDDDH